MRHLIYFTQHGLLAPVVQENVPDGTTIEARGTLSDLLATAELIGTGSIRVADDFHVHLRRDAEIGDQVLSYLNAFVETDRVAIVFHERTVARDYLQDVDWRNRVFLCGVYPPKCGRHADPGNDGKYQRYAALGRYLAQHLLGQTPEPAVMEAVWREFDPNP